MNADELPEGWAQATPDDLAAHVSNALSIGPFGSNLKVSDYANSGTPLVFVRDVRSERFGGTGTRFITEVKARELQAHVVRPGDLLVTKMGDPPGDTAVYPAGRAPAVITADCIKLSPDARLTSSSFLRLALRAEPVREQLREQTMGVAQQKLSLARFRSTLIPLPPFAEQKRILAKAEQLLAHVNAAREHLARVPAMLKRFRQGVLAAACEGKLTEDWRRATGSTAAWRRVALPEVADSRLGKMLDKAKNVGKQKPYLRNINVRWFGFDLSDVQSLRATDREIETLGVKPGDVLVCEGGEPGRCAVWRGKAGQVVYQKALHRVRVGESLSPDYLCYALKNAADTGALEDLFTGSTIKHLTGVSLSQFDFQLPPADEQREIVRRVDALFKLADVTGKRVAAAAARADRLRQAILAKAFRGDLVPTEAELARREGRAYEAASALLERVWDESSGADTRGDGRSKRAVAAGAAKSARAQVRRGA